MARRKPEDSKVPEWLVTFADLMSLLVCFFVLIISFSIQDQEKLQVVAGSMKDAFGILDVERKSGVIEKDGNPVRKFQKSVSPEPTKMDTEYSTVRHEDYSRQGPEANTYKTEKTDVARPDQYALAAVTLKQAWQDMPEITSISDNLIVQDTEKGVNIVIADQKGRSMFPPHSKFPYEATRQALAAMAPALTRLPNQIRITGHTRSGEDFPDSRYGKWDLSADRANAVRAILEEFGVPSERIFSVVGRGDAEPYFPNDPYLDANERVSILLVRQSPPLPADIHP